MISCNKIRYRVSHISRLNGVTKGNPFQVIKALVSAEITVDDIVFTIKTVLTSIQYIIFLTLQDKETNIRGHKLTQNKVQKKIKNRDQEKVPTIAKQNARGS